MAFNNVFDSSLIDYSKDFEQQDEKAQLIDKCADGAISGFLDNEFIYEFRDALNELEHDIKRAKNYIRGESITSWVKRDFGTFIDNLTVGHHTKQYVNDLKTKIGLDLEWIHDNMDEEYINQCPLPPNKVQYLPNESIGAKQNIILKQIIKEANRKMKDKNWLRNMLIEEIDKMLK